MPAKSYCRRDMQKFLLSLRQIFCRRIAKANWKILNLPRNFIADLLSTRISKADYYNLLFLLLDWVTSFPWHIVGQIFKVVFL